MTDQRNVPLSDDEFVELDDFLLQGEQEERLPVDMAHGYITALRVGHIDVTDDEWMGAVWGEPEFADDAEQQRMTNLLLRLHDEIVNSLESGEPFEPLLVEIEENGESYEACEGWCYGFMLGISRDEAQWESLPEHERNLLMPIARLALFYAEEEEDLDDDEYIGLAELLPGAVAGLYAYWDEQLA
jgi:uncharacterized protein